MRRVQKNFVWVVLVVASAGCLPELPEGRFACVTATDCPEDYFCYNDRCYSHPSNEAPVLEPAEEEDENAVSMDGGTAAVRDAGREADASSSSRPDASQVSVDAGATPRDAGMLVRDAGMSMLDAGVPANVCGGREEPCCAGDQCRGNRICQNSICVKEGES